MCSHGEDCRHCEADRLKALLFELEYVQEDWW